MKPEKILKIIEEQEVFTVKLLNQKLFKIVNQMEKEGLIQLKDVTMNHSYYGKPDGRVWTLKGGYENE